MADIERWITVNGVHIPIMKGEGAMEAVGRFIKGKRLNKEHTKYKKYREEELNSDKIKNMADKSMQKYAADIRAEARLRSERQKIKGYSTDPDRKEEKAQNAFKNTMKEYESDIKKAEADLDAFLRQDTYNTTKNMNKTERAIFENRRKREEAELRYYRDMTPIKAEERALRSYENAKIFTPSKRYKLKAADYKLSKAESKLQDFAQTSKSEYNISNIKAKELPSGAIHITTKSGRDISTISPKALTAAEKNVLRKKGILK